MEIYNCHTHTFTFKSVPENFIPVPTSLLTKHGFNQALITALRTANPFDDEDMMERYANFVEQGNKASQREIFLNLQQFYNKMVVLSMDMEYMGAGKVAQPFEEQLDELYALKKEFPEQVYPFVFADPRRPNVLDIVKDCIENKQFAGIKLYPALGYYPFDERLDGVYAYAEQHHLPLMTHCTKSGVHYKGTLTDADLVHPKTGKPLKKEKNNLFARNYGDPDNYVYVLEKFPHLKLCFGHFGGASEWFRYLNEPENYRDTWYHKVKTLLKNPAYPNLYTDISYTISVTEKKQNPDDINPSLLDVLYLSLQDEVLREKILFGSDFYMTNIEANEFKTSVRLRRQLGEAFFFQMANTNAKRYLNE